MKKVVLGLFVIVLIVELVFLSNSEWSSYRVFTKPLLMSLLLIYFLMHDTERRTRLLVVAALLFSLLGDILLLFTERSEMFFISGLISFLLAHIFYSVQFSRKRNKGSNILKPLLPLLIFGTSFFYFLKDDLNQMLIPVSIYMLVILTMAFFAFLRNGNVPGTSYLLVVFGALLFLCSDGILAIDKFRNPLPFSEIMIMATYGLAQLLIVQGIIKEKIKPPRAP